MAATDPPPLDALRMIDAAANRASEGLRVVEDFLRFALDDGYLTSLCKALRHDLTALLAALPSAARHAARDTQADVGTRLTTAAESQRLNLTAVAAANFKRAEQALRTLEEAAKTFDGALAARLEQLRYRVYTLEKAADIGRASRQRLAAARIYVIVDGRSSAPALAELAEQIVAGGADVIQLREKQLADRELLERARLLRKITRGSATLLIVNDRPDLACLAQADGVHVGQDELSVKDARAIVGSEMLVGVSTHSLAQARQAVLDGANYIGVGPTFPSGTKSFVEFPGVELLRAVQAEIRLPAFAIGGITATNLGEVTASGFSRIAVSGAIVESADPQTATTKLRAALTGDFT